MQKPTWKDIRRPANIYFQLCVLAGAAFLYGSCATNNKAYQAPKLGAEYRFDEGLRKEKHPQYLFDKKTRKDMEKMGLPSGERNVPVTATAPAAKTSTAGGVTAPAPTDSLPADSMRMDSVYKVKRQ